MQILRKSSENEMVALFLKGEIASTRFNEKLLNILKDTNSDENIITNYNLKNQKENETRKKILGMFRGYGINKKIFENFPLKTDWYWVKLQIDELQRIKYINYDYWVELSNGSRLAKDSVDNIKSNIEIFGVSNNGFIKAAEFLNNGNKFAPIILIAPKEYKENIVVLEGHLRLTAMNLVKDKIDSVEALIGFAKEKDLIKWNLF